MPNLVAVTGTVKVDGQPAEGVEVTFVPAIGYGANPQDAVVRLATGVTDSSGKYSLVTPPGGPVASTESDKFKGALPGKYAATFHWWVTSDGKSWSATPGQKQGPAVSGAIEKLPPQLGNPMSTTHKVEVKSGANTFDFDLKTK